MSHQLQGIIAAIYYANSVYGTQHSINSTINSPSIAQNVPLRIYPACWNFNSEFAQLPHRNYRQYRLFTIEFLRAAHFPARIGPLGPQETTSWSAGSAARRISKISRDPAIWGAGHIRTIRRAQEPEWATSAGRLVSDHTQTHINFPAHKNVSVRRFLPMAQQISHFSSNSPHFIH